MVTFGQLKESGILDVAGNCADNPKFAQLVNDATRRLLRRGDWSETAVPIYLCVYAGCVVLPRYVGAIRRINICNHALQVQNQWYKFLPANQDKCGWLTWKGPECGLFQDGVTSVFQDIKGDGRLVRAYPRIRADIGKTIQIFGIGNDGQKLMSRRSDNTFREGVTITIGDPFGSTSVYVRSIEYTIKDATHGPVNLYAYDVANNVLEDLAQYDPSETLPQYSRVKLQLPTANCCNGLRGVLAMVKLRFIPVENDFDLVCVPNEDALELMIQSIKSQRAGDFTNFQNFEGAAVAELNRQLDNEVPPEEFAATDNTLGPWTWNNQCF